MLLYVRALVFVENLVQLIPCSQKLSNIYVNICLIRCLSVSLPPPPADDSSYSINQFLHGDLVAGQNMTCKQFNSIRIVSGLSFTLTESKSALMWLLSESEVCLLCQSSHNQSRSLYLWSPAKAMTQTNTSMRIQHSLWTGEQASAGTKLENANGDKHIYTRPQLFKRQITIRYPMDISLSRG